MKPLTLFLLILLIFLVIIATYPYTSFIEGFKNNNDTQLDNINLNVRLNNNNNNIIKRPRVIVPLYAPWRMYYPYESVYQFPIPWQYQSSPFYPFFDQYNIYQNMIPYYN
jgi:hypothetical protein